jgi:hypothetical protein
VSAGAGYVRSSYSLAEIDAIAAHSPDLGRSYLIPIEEISTRSSLHVRVAPAGNNQVERINWTRDHELEAALQRLRDARL